MADGRLARLVDDNGSLYHRVVVSQANELSERRQNVFITVCGGGGGGGGDSDADTDTNASALV